MLAFLLLAMVALFWAGNTIVARAASEAVPPMALTFWRLFLSALVFAPLALRNAGHCFRVVRRDFWLLNLLALLSMSTFNALVYSGLRFTEAINGNLLQGALPLCILVSGLIFMGQRVTCRQWVGVVLGMTGLAVIVIRGDINILMHLRIGAGDPLVFAGVFASAVYAVFLHRRPQDLDLVSFLFLMMLLGSLQVAPFYAFEHFLVRPLPLTDVALWTIAYVALFPSVLAQWFFAEGVRRIGAATAGYIIYLTPVFGVVMAVGLLGETFRLFHAIGICLIAAGIGLAVIRVRQI